MFKIKYNFDGIIEVYKVRRVTQRFAWIHEINYIKTFAPTIRHKFRRIFLAIIVMISMIFI